MMMPEILPTGLIAELARASSQEPQGLRFKPAWDHAETKARAFTRVSPCLTCSPQRRYCVQSAKRVDETSAKIRLQGFEFIWCRDRLSTTSMQLAATCILIQAPKTNSVRLKSRRGPHARVRHPRVSRAVFQHNHTVALWPNKAKDHSFGCSHTTSVASDDQPQPRRQEPNAFHLAPLSCDTLAEWLRRRPAKPMRSPRVGSNPTGVVCNAQLQAGR